MVRWMWQTAIPVIHSCCMLGLFVAVVVVVVEAEGEGEREEDKRVAVVEGEHRLNEKVDE